MMHDLAYLLLVGGGFMAALGLVGGLYEYVIDPLWEMLCEYFKEAKGGC